MAPAARVNLWIQLNHLYLHTVHEGKCRCSVSVYLCYSILYQGIYNLLYQPWLGVYFHTRSWAVSLDYLYFSYDRKKLTNRLYQLLWIKYWWPKLKLNWSGHLLKFDVLSVDKFMVIHLIHKPLPSTFPVIQYNKYL